MKKFAQRKHELRSSLNDFGDNLKTTNKSNNNNNNSNKNVILLLSKFLDER